MSHSSRMVYAMEKSALIHFCCGMLSMSDPASYVEIQPMDRKIAAKARECHSHLYPMVKRVIHKDLTRDCRVNVDSRKVHATLSLRVKGRVAGLLYVDLWCARV
eukprot:4486273-Amphidinium_carterae.1